MEYLSFRCGGDIIPDKFLVSINGLSSFNEEFNKKVCGYSMYDREYLQQVVSKLLQINRKDIILAYNEWYLFWNLEQNKELKRVAEWYVKECEKKYRDLNSTEMKPERKVIKECTKEELLLQKKKLLLEKKLLMQQSKR